MLPALHFWLPAIVVLAIFEAVLFQPAWLWYYLPALVLAIVLFAWHIAREEPRRTKFSFLALLLTTALGAFFWLLWLDFVWFKFSLPLLLLAVLLWLTLPNRAHGKLSADVYLALFLAGVFFWSTVTFGLLTVLGWPLWKAVSIFLIVFILLAQGAESSQSDERARLAAILLVLLGMELWAVIVWLPFGEAGLGLLLTLAVLLIYDLLKYFIDPTLVRRRIIWRKIAIYGGFSVIVLLLLQWQ